MYNVGKENRMIMTFVTMPTEHARFSFFSLFCLCNGLSYEIKPVFFFYLKPSKTKLIFISQQTVKHQPTLFDRFD